MKTINEKIRDRTVRHMLYLERLKTQQANQILKTVDDDIIPDLIHQLEQRLINVENFGFDRGTETTARIEQLIEQLGQITGRFKDINTRIQGDLFELAEDEVKWQIGSILDETKIDIDFITPSTTAIRQAVTQVPFDGRTVGQWFKRLDESTQERLGQAIRRGVVEGQTTTQIVQSIRGTKALNYRDGVLNTTRAQTEAVVKSALQHVSNASRAEMFKANESLIKGVQWVATLDSKTCLQCAPLDGKIYPVNKGVRPPIHVSCRCTMVAVLKSWQEIGIDVQELDAGTRASFNGQVSDTITYNEWLKTQPRNVVVEALGETRAKLFIDGNLDVSAFVTNRRRELTLPEIRQREKSAFDRAGV